MHKLQNSGILARVQLLLILCNQCKQVLVLLNKSFVEGSLVLDRLLELNNRIQNLGGRHGAEELLTSGFSIQARNLFCDGKI